MRRRGQSLVEYALLLAAVGLLVLGGAGTASPALHRWFEGLAARIVAGV